MQKFIIGVPDDKTHQVKEFLEKMDVIVVETSNSSISPEEVIAAGGAMAYGIKFGKSMEEFIKRRESLPEPWTDEEWADLMEQMANDK